MRKLTTYSVALVALSVLLTTSAFASTRGDQIVALHVRPATVRSVTTQQVRGLRRGIAWHRSRTWYWQTRAGVARTQASHAETRTRSVPFLRWIDHLWLKRQVHARRFATGPLPASRDWLTSVSIVQRVWHGTKAWLLSCSAHEGGHGAWVPNSQGSGVGGWMQYASGTFWSHYNSAVAAARRMHRPLPPPSTASWYSAEGQAYAAGWARLYTDYHVPWNPAQDPYCE